MTARRSGVASLLAFIAVAVLGVSQPVRTSQATTGSRVLVMPFVANVDPTAPGGAGAALWLGEAASLVITEGLVAQGVGALSREDRVAAFDRLNLTMSGALTRATMIRVGELIGASEVVFGEVRLKDTLEVSARLIRLDAGREMPVIADRAPLSELFGLFGRVAGRLATHTGRARPVSQPVPPMPLDAFENYVKGLVAATPAAEQRFLESAVRLAPGDPRILLALWGVHTAQGNPDRALASASAVPASAQAYRQARFAVALSLVDLKRYDGAYQALTDLAGRERSAAVSNALGVVQLRRGLPSTGQPATLYLRRAVDDDPENVDYLFNLGYAYALVGNVDEALSWLREAVRIDVADPEAHLVMSALLAGRGRVAEAQREFDLAKLLGAEVTGAAPAARVPASLERLPTDVRLSTSLRVRAIASAPAQRDQQEAAAFHLANGRALVAAQRDREAVNELRRAIYLAPYQDEPHLLLGQVYHRTGLLQEAVDELTVAVWSRDSARGRLALAEALLATGERDAARQQAQRALALEPASAEAQLFLKRVSN